MKARRLAVEGAFEFTPDVHCDNRGHFASPFQEPAFVEATGHTFTVAQTNHSKSARDVVRGVHFTTTPPGQAKYVYCPKGRVRDLVLDVRVGSPTFGVWDVVELDEDSLRAVYFPLGVGHAFHVIEDGSVMAYMVSTGYVPAREISINPFDPALDLPWPIGADLVVSDRDRVAPTLAQAREKGLLPVYSDCVAD
ncbi:dTDP-4-dehydrorhamnose 3,5-epimerase family protein [Actinophytocola oryzae]|uniref:dTDP-4-dehydrorhamnose 3,5-epimerase n=1 Tax=Actinophytocola oryzae TaxID=502181 RepID=A0A4R7UV82_9PSEU|nr:dTDP-4-dehydrorhamnose 3,5-epimerase [Actinophytocola oryzae]TDV38580.1 dTDP-4-dehydrorhamnose 3,5-epimerase [Actinophytocola oryzae]